MKVNTVRWAVHGSHGLYIGQWLRRVDAIAEHSSQGRRIDDPETSKWARGGKLSQDQAANPVVTSA
jgi:hypothetical protein